MTRNRPLKDERYVVQKGKWEWTVDFNLLGWGIGVYFQVAHDRWYPYALCVDAGPFLFGIWYHPNRVWRKEQPHESDNSG